MRYRSRFLLLVLLVHAVIAIFLWSWFKNVDISDGPRVLWKPSEDKSKSFQFKEIQCNINGEYNIECRKNADEVYVPFSFIKKYFDIYGKIVEKDGIQQFNWSHSYASVYVPKKKYDPRGVFTHFHNFKVEERERVKCITASEGVPLSTQWDPKGYYYPTQIAQFGLSHYSKALTEAEPKRFILEDGENTQANWIVSYTSSVKRSDDYDVNSITMCFDTLERKPAILQVNASLPVVIFDLKLRPNDISEVVITALSDADKRPYNLHYTCGNDYITVSNYDIYYGLLCNGEEKWTHLSRDIYVDVQKGILFKTKTKPKLQRSPMRIEKISLKGTGCIDNLTIASSDHMGHFRLTADWFLKYQDWDTGGWPNPVTRKMASVLVLKPGWYSAMGQGHGLSVLSRAYRLTKNPKYLEAARKALKPFSVTSKNHGVLASFMNELRWYEEYPTEPPTFVLNGFVYSLLGLYDFYKLAPTNYSSDSYMLYVQGMTSLKRLLLLFDTGSGTTYDLRHLSLGIAPKLARWDYHATHINQLLLLSSIDKDPLFSTTAKRWMGYMNGKRASHN